MAEVGAAVAELLVEGGVRRFYTVPGESFLGVLDAADRHPDLRVVSTRHESGAAFMAEGDAKLTGRPAVVAATRGVGASNLAIGVHTAMQDSTPMLALIGQVDTRFLGREAFQEVDLPAFYAPITKWAVTAPRADRIPELVAQGLRIAQSGRPGPVMIALPADLLDEAIDDQPVALARRRLAMRTIGPAADPEGCAEVARRLRAARRPVLVAGGGAQRARAELVAVAERYATGVYASFRRQDVFPNSHPLYLGHLGVGVAGPRLEALREADLVVVVGARLSEITTGGYRLPAPGSQVVQVDVDPAVVGAVAAVDLGLVADARAFLAGLLARPGAGHAARRDWSAARQAFEASLRVPPSRARRGVDPAQVIRAMRSVLPPDAVVANDAGNFSGFLHQHWCYDSPRSQVAPTSGAMGYGLPAAIGARLAAPDRPVVGLAGDGGFLMTGQELETAVRERADLLLIVFRNGLHGTVAMHQARTVGRLAAVRIGAVDIARFATSLGAAGYTVDREADLVPVLEEARGVRGPSVVQVVTDPDVISPATTLSQLLHGLPAG